MMNLSKQETFIVLDFDQNTLYGRTRIRHSPQDSYRLSLYCKQLEITKVWGSGPLSYTYPAPSNQSQWLSYALNNTLDTNDLMDMSWQLWDYEMQQGGYLVITLPINRGEVVVNIEYKLESPVAGVRFFDCNGRKAVVTEGLHESKRYWMPCLDGLHHKYPLALEIKVPEDYYVISSGELSGLITEDNSRFFQYNIHTYISTIGFCAAPIAHVLQDPHSLIVTHFSLRSEKELTFTINNPRFSYGKMLTSFSEKFAKPFPFKSQKVVFIPNIGESLRFAGLSIIDDKYLINENLHEGFFEVVRELVSSASFSWLECYFRMVSWADYWLMYGLQEYFGRSYVGEVDMNELKFILNKDVKKYCMYVEKGLELRPLCNMFFTCPNDLLTDPVFRLKSGLIFHMIEGKVGKPHLKNVLQVFLAPSSTTSEFIKSFKKLFRISLKEFAKNWIYGTGAPLLQCRFQYNKRDNTLDFSLDQSPLFQSYLDSSANKQFPSLGNTNYVVPLRTNMMRFYTGPLSIIIYETDGMEIESFKKDIEVNKEHFRTQIQCKKKLKKPNNPKRREETEEEKFNRQNECPVLWVRVDPDFEVLRKVEITYNDFMWMEQLKKEKEDVLAQYEAITAARSSMDYTNVLNLLYDKLEDKSCFYRVRMKAAKSLSAISYPINAFKGLDYLIYYFKSRHFDKKFLKKNDFTSREEYFVDKTVLKSIIKVSDMSLTHNYSRIRVNSSFVVEFLADILKNNDNSSNTFDDSYWRGTLLEVLGNTTNPVYVAQIFQEMIWNFKIDLTIPSYNFIITNSCLKGLLRISQQHKLSLQTTYNYFNSKLFLYPPRVQAKIVMFMVNYLYLQHENPREFIRIPLRLIKANPQFANFYVKCLWKMLIRLFNTDWVLHDIRSDEEIRACLWDLCTSPYAQANQYFSYTLSSVYRYFFPRDWSRDSVDPVWEEKQDMDPYQHRFEAIDLSKGSWEEWAEEVLSRMTKHEYSGPFLEPVDYESEGLYDYPEIIAHPMDFSTVHAKLVDGQYSNFHDLVADVRLIFDNCRLYNAVGCTLYKHAEMLDSLFRDLVAPIEEHLGISQPEVKLKLRMFAGDIQIEYNNN